MAVRPLVTNRGERTRTESTLIDEPGLSFDKEAGVWRDSSGQLAVRSPHVPGTMKTATREGTDQPELTGSPSTMITRSREGADQPEVSHAPMTRITETREGVDQPEFSG
jgi:hypothetical protein